MHNQALEPQSSSDLGTEPLFPLGTSSGSSGDDILCLGWGLGRLIQGTQGSWKDFLSHLLEDHVTKKAAS